MAEETQDPKTAEEAEAQETPALPENTIDVEDAGTLKKKLTVTISRQRIDAKLEEMFGELRGTAQIPGFRIGHAPRRLIEKRFGKDVSNDVRNALVGESIGEAIESTELKTLGQPDIDLEAITLPESGDMSFSFEVEVSPEFDLPSLEDIKVEKRAAEMTDELIDEYVDQLRQGRASYEATEEPAQEGDLVTAAARITGEDIDPVDRPGLQLRVAPGQIEGLPLVDLPKALTGKKGGETAELSIEAPEAHPTEGWRGKTLNIALSISQVRRRILPELDDEFVESMGFGSLDELREFVSTRLQQRLIAETRRSMREQVQEYLLNNTQFDLPEGVATRQTARVLQRRYVNLLQQGVPREKIDENLTELQAAARDQAQREIKLQFMLSKIAEERDIQVEEAEINARIAGMASQYGRRPERIRQELAQGGSMEALHEAIRDEKVLDQLLSKAKVEEPPAEIPEASDKKDSEKDSEKKPKTPAKKKVAKKASGKTSEKTSKKAPKSTTKKTATSKAKSSAKTESKTSAKKQSKKSSKKKS